jgi:hypothetical protein
VAVVHESDKAQSSTHPGEHTAHSRPMKPSEHLTLVPFTPWRHDSGLGHLKNRSPVLLADAQNLSCEQDTHTNNDYHQPRTHRQLSPGSRAHTKKLSPGSHAHADSNS